MEVHGSAQCRFSSIYEASRTVGLSVPAIIARITRNSIVEGIRFSYEENPPTNEEHTKPKKQYIKPKPVPKAPRGTKPKEEKRYELKQKPLNRDKYTIVPYEVKNKRVCITKCTVVDFPQPFIGSFNCQKCPHFQGIDRVTHEVACSNLFRK